MNIKLDENWSVQSDAYQWILNYRKEGEINEKTNKPKISEDSYYYGTLGDAVKAYTDKKLQKMQGDYTVEKVVQNLKEIIADLKNSKIVKIESTRN